MLLPLRFQNLGPIAGAPATPAIATRPISKGYKVTAAQLAQIKREDEEMILLIALIGEHL